MLVLCGFDSLFSLSELNESYIEKIESHINAEEMEAIQSIDCCYADYYKNLHTFKFLPGHAAVILSIPKYVEEFKNAHKPSAWEPNGRFPFILEEMIRTAESNLFKDINHAAYSENIRYFATYIFLLCGRSCYEMLRANLPLPSTKTIC